MLTASDYLDWQKYSGTCFTHESPVAMLRLAEQELSPAGAVVLFVSEFLDNNRDGLDLFCWRNDVLALPQVVVVQHVQRTARALTAIGASRMAAVLPTIEAPAAGGLFAGIPTQLPDMKSIQEMMRAALSAAGGGAPLEGRPGAIRDLLAKMQPTMHPAAPPAPQQHPPVESLAELQQLLEQFVSAHQAELEGDINRYGDPRKMPGFDPRRRLEEIEEKNRRRAQWAFQDQQADEFQRELQALQKASSAAASAKSKKLLRLATKLFANYQGWAGSRGEISVKLTHWLADFEQFRDARPDLFRRSPTRDANLTSRLEAIGEYLLEENSRMDGYGKDEAMYRLTWQAPRRLECDWTNLWLRFELPRNDAALTAVLETWDRFTQRTREHLDKVRGELLEHFHLHHGDDPGPFLRKLYCDEAGNVVAEMILKEVGRGRLEVEAFAPEEKGEPTIVNISAHFAVPWDDEHGFETGVDIPPIIQ